MLCNPQTSAIFKVYPMKFRPKCTKKSVFKFSTRVLVWKVYPHLLIILVFHHILKINCINTDSRYPYFILHIQGVPE